MPHHRRTISGRLCAATLAAAVLLGLSACASRALERADAVPSPSAAAPAPSGTAAAEPTPTAEPEEEPAAWTTVEVGDGRTSWRIPDGWTAEIDAEVVEGRAEWTDYRGLVRDASGTPMLRFEAIASGGQYATDFWPCERPETEVFEVTPLPELVVGSGAAVVSLAFKDGTGEVTFAAGVSQNDAQAACEPGILALHGDDAPGGYDYLLLQIVDDEGMSYPQFADFAAARAYLDSDEYLAIREVLGSFEHR
ncbi:hypothetical protein [Agrococcus sp. TF02-05]|uniref:hypothetical protein n=1 Tax=Agrococcus sp. TF02-05 TaxID=2815211 RepID=UPI001AA0E035|nr:hypothetical protein [Agrococcus sp. TF02-05]MBO1770899.1 hypothetical protein [Agrococcus sp. TF02-05]